MRVHAVCKLRRGDLDWNEGKAMLIGKAEAQFNPITTETGRGILDVQVVEALGLAAAGTITPLLCVRKDALHQATTCLTKTRSAIMLENLNVSGKDLG